MQVAERRLAVPSDFAYSCSHVSGEVTGLTSMWEGLLYPFDGGPAEPGTRFYSMPVDMKIEVLRTGLTTVELRQIVEQATRYTQLTAESRYTAKALIDVNEFDQMLQHLVNHSQLHGVSSFQELMLGALGQMGTLGQILAGSPTFIHTEMRSVVAELNALGVVLIQARSLNAWYPIRVTHKQYMTH